MRRMKKALAWLASLTLLCAVCAAVALPASAMDELNLLPDDVSLYEEGSVEDQVLDGEFTVENGALTMKSAGEDTAKDGYRVHINIDQTVSIAEAVSIFVNVESDVPFNIALVVEDVNGGPAWVSFSNEFFNRFSVLSNALEIENGSYERELDFSDACTYNANIPTDEVLVQQVQVALKRPNGTLTLSKLSLGDTVEPSPVLDDEGNPVTQAPTEAPEPTEADDEGDVTAAPGATTAKPSGNASGTSSAPTTWIIIAVVCAVVVVLVIVIVVVVVRKKKNPKA